jgi:hypothetical protein
MPSLGITAGQEVTPVVGTRNVRVSGVSRVPSEGSG